MRAPLDRQNSSLRAYLAGAIERAPDGGRRWREEITPFLVDRLGHEVYDPALDEIKNLGDEEQRNFRSWKSWQPERFRHTVRKIIDYDLAILGQSQYVICYWDRYAALGGGTQGELTFACQRRIPVFLVRSLSLDEISGWVLGCCDEVVAGFDDLRRLLLTRYERNGGS